ncbi:uncharacterized protein LOC121645000 [Melanotaenia boesemani]|uniref:uncharacterized protein LOC121645000 n=1 Tax=Melanotaenia boesemani TaxID=1250792 RepID=UPI001C056592|nr:uncharacterized protein LOC121645000 [Melanotaenia boesemani]
MLFLPAAALCWLCSALVAMAAELIQDDLTLTRRVGQSVSFRCGNIHLCDQTYIYWYQKKETFRAILLIDKNSGSVHKPFNHPQEDDFSAVNIQNGCELQIEKVKLVHSATYYCSCYKSVLHRWSYLIFGSGTKLYVTDEQVVKPVVSVYPAASRVHQEGRSSLLCLASAMFPPLVQFSWKRQKEDGSLEELLPAEGDQLEIRESGRSAAIRVVDRDAFSLDKQTQDPERSKRIQVSADAGNPDAQMVKQVVNVCPIESNVHQEGKSSLLCLASAMFPPLVQFSWKRQKEDGSLEELLPAEGQFRGSRQSAVIRVVDGDALCRYKYICYVKHEGGTVEAQTQQEVPASPPPPPPPPASPPPVHATVPPLLQEEIFPPSDPATTSVPVLHPVKLSVSFQSELRVKLLLLLSTVLIVKSLVYCCGLSLLMILRNKGPSTNCTHAD